MDNKAFQYIRNIQLDKTKIPTFSQYPFCLDSVKQLGELALDRNITYIIGENGSGKSTLLEAIAVAYGFNPEGGSKNFNFATSNTHSCLHDYIKLIKGVRLPKDCFFLRAESFYNVSTNVDELVEIGGASLYESYGGKSLHKQSHGESFMSLVSHRFRGNGLYILDEPEAALSPSRQLSLLSIIHELVKENSQFIIATHSPIIMAYPDSTIYSVDDGYSEIEYKETQHYQLTKMFLDCPERMLKNLFD